MPPRESKQSAAPPVTNLESVRVQEYDWNKVPDNGFVVVTGRRGSGKSTLVKELMYRKRHVFDYGVVMSGTQASIEDYSQYIPETFIHEGYNSELLASIIEKQENARKRKEPLQKVFVILEDCMWEKKKIWKDIPMRRLAMNGRWDNIFAVITMQYPMDFGPELRSQVDTVFACIEKNPQNRLRIYNCFNPCFNNFEQFDAVMRVCTASNDVMALQNSGTNSDTIEESVYWCRAKLGRKFHMSRHKPWWDFHSRNFDPLGATVPTSTTSTDGKQMTKSTKSESIVDCKKRSRASLPTSMRIIKSRTTKQRQEVPTSLHIGRSITQTTRDKRDHGWSMPSSAGY